MTGPAPLAFPGSRTLAGWWQQLAAHHPRTMWAGHLLLHRLDAPVRRTEQRRLDAVDRLVLQALGLFPDTSLEQLDRNLQLGTQLLGRVLAGLHSEGLVQLDTQGWRPTALGQLAADEGSYPRSVPERRIFYFAASDHPGHAPHFLHIDQPTTVPWSANADWTFDVRLFQACFAQSVEWKQRHRFPSDLDGMDAPTSQPSASETWQRVLLDRPERLPTVVIRTESPEGDCLLGFAVRQDNWQLQSSQPVLTLATAWRDVLPELADDPATEACHVAWRSWCQPRGLIDFGDDVTGFRLEGHVLRVTPTGRLLERLRATRSEVLRDEAWVLIGAGRLRLAALLKIVEPGSPAASPSK